MCLEPFATLHSTISMVLTYKYVIELGCSTSLEITRLKYDKSTAYFSLVYGSWSNMPKRERTSCLPFVDSRPSSAEQPSGCADCQSAERARQKKHVQADNLVDGCKIRSFQVSHARCHLRLSYNTKETRDASSLRGRLMKNTTYLSAIRAVMVYQIAQSIPGALIRADTVPQVYVDLSSLNAHEKDRLVVGFRGL
ncbi:hypothetical protein M422DRAFT_43162 [Sphaerobolus stellatus SS14]|nr:hypothetical protein M422DRAFT_43162 [Sphaerobolus stellatus SS14]